MLKLPRITQWETISLEAAEEVSAKMAAAAEHGRKHSYNALAGLALGTVCVLLALVKVAPANSSEATEQQLEQIYKEVEYQTQQQLGVDVVVNARAGAPKPRLPESYDRIELRENKRAGVWLPDSLRFIYDGRLVGNLPLKRYVEFELSVVHVTQDVAPQTRIDPAWLEVSTETLSPGSPVLIKTEDASGSMARTRLRSGDLLYASKMQRAWDIQRGDNISLVMEGPGLSMSAQAVAQGNAYIGQRVTVKRLGDNARFSGTLAEGPVVLIETEGGK